MRVLAWSRSVTAAARALRERGQAKARGLIAQLTAPPPPAQLPRQSGPELARQCLGDAAAALLDKGASQPEAFRLLRLELNRLEQGGLAATRPEPIPAAPTPPPRPTAQLASWAIGELRARAARVLRAA